jgi:hypothetical protein
MSKRISILPDSVLAVLDDVAPRGNRNAFIAEATLHHAHPLDRKRLRDLLRAGYKANASESLRIARELFPAEY